MKKKPLYFLMILPLVITVAALFFLPNQVPIRYSSKGIQYGSKFSLLIISVLGVWIEGLLVLVSKATDNAEEDALVWKIAYIPAVIFNVVNMIAVAGAFLIREDGSGLKVIDIVAGCLTGAIAVLLAVYVSFTARQRGPILSNSYLWLSEEEKKTADTRAEYWLITRVFGGLALIFVMLTLNIFTSWKWTLVVMWVLIAGVLVYAVYDSVKSAIKK